MASSFNSSEVRSHFPSLGRETVFFDGPAGTQVPRECVTAVADYYLRSNSNSAHGAPFRPTAQSKRTEHLIDETHAAMADFIGADDAASCIFGPNMTTLAFAMARRIGATFREGDELLLSAGDHDANVACWLAVAQERDLTVRWIEPSIPECALGPERVAALIGPRTRVVSLGLASNAVGTLVTPPALRAIADAAHRAGALLWVDAVHAAPHVPLEVSRSGADAVLLSAYKLYGPHLGVAWLARERLDALVPHNVRWRGGEPLQRYEQGTQAYELFAGLVGTFAYLRWLGRTYGVPADASRRAELRAAVEVIRAHESALAAHLLRGLAQIPGMRVYGIADPGRPAERCPTIGFRVDGVDPALIADRCVSEGFAIWSGEFACFELMKRLALDATGGLVRIGIAHYNTAEEVDALVAVVRGLVPSSR